MNVMNIKHYLSAFAALAMLAACSEYDPGISDQVVDFTDAEIDTITKYTANFIQRYGEMDPDHTWGFGELAELDDMGTRTQIDVKRNQWVVLNKDNQENRNLVSITSHELMGGATIPGFPSSVDGLYHIWNDYAGSGDYTNHHEAITYDELAAMVKKGTDEVVPAGDVTDEEILYVSAWFRTHYDPKSDPLNVDNFFVQTISKDYDRQGYGTMSGETTSSWAESQSYPYLQTLPIKYVLNGQEVQYDYNGNPKGNVTGSPVTYELDYLAVQKAAGEEYEHINNFNSSNTPKISQNNPTASNADYSSAVGEGKGIDGTSHRMMEYVYETGTHDFEVHSSNIDVLEHNWVLKHLTFTGRDGKNYDGWYLAFDIAYTKTQEKVTSNDPGANIKTLDAEGNLIENIDGYWEKSAYRDYDGYYSNYIVKIIPGNGTTTKTRTATHKRRVMCEDLGSTFDFDFNDLVFDVVYSRQEQLNSNNVWEPVNSDGLWDVTVTLQASGGTLPIYIKDFEEQKYNVHELFGCTQSSDGLYSPVNVGTGYTHDPVTLNFGRTASTNPEDIAILVYSKDAERSATHELVLPNPSGLQSFGTQIAPMKICVPTYVRWTKEYQQIEWAYPRFADWVTSESGTAGFGHENDWTLESVDSYLY